MKKLEYENLAKLNAPFAEAMKHKFASVVDKGWFVLGSEVDAFEKEFALFLGVPFFLGVASGLDALEMPLKIKSFPSNSEVIVPSNTYIATVNAVLNAGLKPVFVEPEPTGYGMDASLIESKINERTKAIIVVHLYGLPTDMDPILQLCEKYQLELIEDCAQSHGTLYKGKKLGSFGFGAFSFYPTKTLGALGDGGGIAIQNEADYRMLKAWRNYGSHVKYQNEYIGDNSRLDEIQAAFLRIKLEQIEQTNQHRRQLAQLYLNKIKNPNITLPVVLHPDDIAWHIFPILHPKRDALRAYLLEKGIDTQIHYPICPADQKSIKKIFEEKNWSLHPQDFERARLIHANEISLPISTFHTAADIEFVADTLNSFD